MKQPEGIGFGLLVAISLLVDNTSFGFPFWFYKDACSIRFNPKTSKSFGNTNAADWLNFVLDFVFAFIIAFGALFLVEW